MSEQNDIKTNADQLLALASTFTEDFLKFYEKDNSTAATRARKSLLELGKLTRTLRKQVQERKVALKAKPAPVAE